MKDYQKITFAYEVPASDVSMSEIKVEMTLKNDYALSDVVSTFVDFCKCLGFYNVDTQTIIDILEENK